MCKATTRLFATAILLSMSAAPAFAQSWDESAHGGGDAGETMSSYQDLSVSEYSLITGVLQDEGDVDMYKIFIVDPTNFTATTVKSTYDFPADAFDTWLFLFDSDGNAVYSNDESPLGDPANTTYGKNSLLPKVGDLFLNPNGHGPTLPGYYYLAVSHFPELPVNAVGEFVFDQLTDLYADPDRINGPAAGVSTLLDAWDGNGYHGGAYEIALQGTPLPVELADFSSAIDGEAVVLRWSTMREADNAGFDVQMAKGNGSFQTIAFVASQGASTEQTDYVYRVEGLSYGKNEFRLRHVGAGGALLYSPVVEATIVPETFFVSEAYPNPFQGTARFDVVLEERQHVTVEMFNILGQRVNTLFDGVVEANQAETILVDGNSLPSAYYIVKVAGDRFVHSQMLSLVK